MIYKGSIWEEADNLSRRLLREDGERLLREDHHAISVLVVRALREENEACAQLADLLGCVDISAALRLRARLKHYLEPIMEPSER